jgi:hypothetical protein
MSLRVLIPVLLAGALPALAQDTDVILHHGKIVTVDTGFRIVSAMALRGDRIVAVMKLAGPKTRRVDLQGKTVLPGLIDSHTHSVAASMYEFDHPVPDMESVADVLKYIRSRAAVTKEGDWITLSQVFITRLRDQRFPTRAELDQAAPRNPVYFGAGPPGMGTDPHRHAPI